MKSNSVEVSGDVTPDIIRELSVKDPDALAGLACFAIDSAAGTYTYLDINFLEFRPQIEWIEGKEPLERLLIAEEIVVYLKTQLMSPPSSLNVNRPVHVAV